MECLGCMAIAALAWLLLQHPILNKFYRNLADNAVYDQPDTIQSSKSNGEVVEGSTYEVPMESSQNGLHPSLPHVMPHLEGSGLHSTVNERHTITLGQGLSIYSDSENVSLQAVQYHFIALHATFAVSLPSADNVCKCTWQPNNILMLQPMVYFISHGLWAIIQ